MALHGRKLGVRRPVTQRKAKIILGEGRIKGKALTRKQRGLFGVLAGGKPLTRRR